LASRGRWHPIAERGLARTGTEAKHQVDVAHWSDAPTGHRERKQLARFASGPQPLDLFERGTA
jgi:hypothetical protein